MVTKASLSRVKRSHSKSKRSSAREDDLLQARKSLSHQAKDANYDGIDRSLQKSSSKAQEVRKTSHGNRDNLLQTCENRNQLVERVSKASEDTSSKPQQVKKASKTQGNNIPQATEEAPRHLASNVPTMADKSKTSRTTANNQVSVTKASNTPALKKKSSPKMKQIGRAHV